MFIYKKTAKNILKLKIPINTIFHPQVHNISIHQDKKQVCTKIGY